MTLANEARRADLAAQVREEHAAVLRAIEARELSQALAAASNHMDNAIRRIASADPAFWGQEGTRLAVPLVVRR